ncbi:hypothetical protein [Amycolatopsis speibonae]|uniref:Uncharacterized protein n=1 Tax=Amycolatopsis speibonae TaxID=1450224 RepID=A0ABV7P7M5_9PSEU
MLSSLLPGLRELRAPIASGYVWLLGLWLAFRPGLPPAAQASGVYKDVLDLGTWAGKAAIFAAVTFAAAEQNLERLKSADVEFVPFEELVVGRVVPGYYAGYPNARAPVETQGRIATVAPSRSMPKPKF